MGAVLLLALAVALLVYGGLLRMRRFSPRREIVRQLGYWNTGERPRDANSALARLLRQVPTTRRLPARRFMLLQGGLAAGTALLLLLPYLMFGAAPNPRHFLLDPLLAGAAPALWLYLQSTRRKALLSRAYPDLLAHLLTQTRAGASSLQAFSSCPAVLREPLRSEVADLVADLAVAPFPAALQRFASRCATPEIRDFANNIAYQQSLGIAMPEVLASEESHSLAMAKQQLRGRIQASAIIMASVTVLLLVNGLFIYFTPVVYDLARFMAWQP